jgi:hypothetical protein
MGKETFRGVRLWAASAATLGAAACGTGGIPGSAAETGTSSPAAATGEASPSASTGNILTATPLGTTTLGRVSIAPSTASAPRTYTETTDNHNGTPIFSSPSGGALPNGMPGAIPYDTPVQVKCWAPNTAGMPSVNAFYDIVGPAPYENVYGSASTFANGDPLGDPGGTHTIDSAVPEC